MPDIAAVPTLLSFSGVIGKTQRSDMNSSLALLTLCASASSAGCAALTVSHGHETSVWADLKDRPRVRMHLHAIPYAGRLSS